MKRAYLFFCISMLLMPLSSAETLIFSGKVTTDKDKIIDGNIFRFLYDEKSNKAFVQTPTTNMIVENQACNSNSVFKVCINRANFSYRNITTYVSYYEIDTAIYKLTGSLLSSSKLTKSLLLPHESAEFTITITNPTNFDITGIGYIEDLSPFSISEVKGCSLDGGQIVWNGTLKSKFDKKCTALITAKNITEKEATYSFIGSLSYFNGFDNEKKLTDLVKITALPRQLKVTQVTEQDIEIKQPFYINMSLQNINKNEKIELVATVIIPNNLLLLKDIPNFDKDINILKRRVTLEPSAVLNYSVYLQAVSQAGSTLSQNFDYTINGIKDTLINSTFIKPIEPMPIVNFSIDNAEYAELSPGQKFVVAARLKNPSRIYQLTDIKARLTAPYNNDVLQRLDKLLPKDYYFIITNTLSIPENAGMSFESGNKSIKLNLALEYSFNGLVNSLNRSLEAKIVQNKTLIQNNAMQSQTRALSDNSNFTKTGTSPKAEDSAGLQHISNGKTGFFDKKALLLSALAFGVIWIILFLIIIPKLRKKSAQ